MNRKDSIAFTYLDHEVAKSMEGFYKAFDVKKPDPQLKRRDLLDKDGENRAVRMFLGLYGCSSPTALQMKQHLEMAGYPYYPDWIDKAPGHLTKGGAQLWLRLLFDLEKE